MPSNSENLWEASERDVRIREPSLGATRGKSFWETLTPKIVNGEGTIRGIEPPPLRIVYSWGMRSGFDKGLNHAGVRSDVPVQKSCGNGLDLTCGIVRDAG